MCKELSLLTHLFYRLLESSMVETKELHTRQVTAADRDLSQLRKDLEGLGNWSVAELGIV